MNNNETPCPFCGSFELRGWQDENNYVIECQNCITRFWFFSHVKPTALELWNDRTQLHSLNSTLDECIKLLEEYKRVANK